MRIPVLVFLLPATSEVLIGLTMLDPFRRSHCGAARPWILLNFLSIRPEPPFLDPPEKGLSSTGALGKIRRTGATPLPKGHGPFYLSVFDGMITKNDKPASPANQGRHPIQKNIQALQFPVNGNPEGLKCTGCRVFRPGTVSPGNHGSDQIRQLSGRIQPFFLRSRRIDLAITFALLSSP